MLTACRGDGLVRRLVPFLVPGAASLALLPLSGPSDVGLTVVAAVLALVSIVAMPLTWGATPTWWRPLPVYLVLLVVAMLREAHGGTSSGFAPLALLPVLWLGLYGTRRELHGAVLLLLLTFVVPLLGQGGAVEVGSWRLVVLMTLIALVVGSTVQTLTRELRRRVADLQAIGRVASSAADPALAREAVCRAACDVSGAIFSVLMEPDATRRTLSSTAKHGLEQGVRLAIGQESSIAVDVLRSGRPIHIADSRDHPGVSSRLVELTGSIGVLFFPVTRAGTPVAVLVLGFSRPLRSVPPHLEQTLEVLAAEASLIIERADLYQLLEVAALTDGLTGASNRRAWDAAVVDHWEQGTTGAGTVVALLDLDHFKAYNDSLGHLAGDELLRACVTAWQQQLRATDVLARWGGEEFAVLLRSCAPGDAAQVLDRLRAAVPGGCTVSVGAAHTPAGQTLDDAVHRADAALYRAKAQGRDRLHWSEEPGLTSAVGV